MAFEKITEAMLVEKAVTAAADRPQGTAHQVKYLFDRLIYEVVVPSFNALIDELGASGAGDIGASVDGVSGTTVQAILESMKLLLDDRYTKSQADGLLADKTSHTQMAKAAMDPQYDADTGVFSFTLYDGTEVSFNTPDEKIAVNFRFDAETQKLVLTLADGSTQEVDLSAFVKPNEFQSSASIVFSAQNGVVTAQIASGSVTDDMLASALKAALTGYKDAAAASATAAKASEDNARDYKDAAQGSQEAAADSETEAYVSEHNAEVWAEGGQLLGHEGATVPQVHTKGAKEWAQDAQNAANAAAGSASAADTRANAAAESAQEASESAASTQSDKTAAAQSAAAAAASEAKAKTSETNAKASETAAKASETAAKTSETNARSSEIIASEAETNALASETKAKASETAAAAGEAAADQSAKDAQFYAQQAETAAGGGVTSWNGRGGNVVPQTGDYTAAMVGADASGAAAGALADAKAYADQKISEIPTPDVSGQIGAHNTDGTAHSDIRQAAANASAAAAQALTDAKAYTDGQIAAIPEPDVGAQIGAHNTDGTAHDDIRKSVTAVSGAQSTHEGDNVKHITAAERADWNSKAAGTHGHTAAQVGAAPASHTHAPGQITGLEGTDYTTFRVRGMAIYPSSSVPATFADGMILGVYDE